jgi:rhamnosyltransferase
MPRVSIIVRSYNESAHIGKLLRGIEAQTVKDLEVIVVDSGSTDETVSIAECHGARVVHIAKSEFSFGRALNRGCDVAFGEIFIFASAHVYPVRRDWLERLIEPFCDDEVVLAYGRQVGAEVTKFSEHQLFATWFPAQSSSRQPHNFCNNANCAIRGDAWRTQRYDETLTGLEDLAWAKKVRQNGGQISYVADAPVAHIHEETWSRIRNRYRREAMALRQIEPNIHFRLSDFLGLSLSNIWHDLLAARQDGCLYREWRAICLFRLNQFFGTWRGHKMRGEIGSTLRNRFYYPASGNKEQRPADHKRSLDEAIIRYD